MSSNTWSLTGNLLYRFAPRTFRPYAVIGHASLDVDDNGGGLETFDS